MASWSKGCHACRRMKVKCDEAQPECARCIRGGRSCPGYRDVVDMRFRSMNPTVAPRSVVPTRAEPTRPPKVFSPQLYITPSTNWEQYAFVRFIDQFTEPQIFAAPGYLDFLPQMLKLDSECLREAVLAASMANLANISSMRQLEVLSREHYGRALRALQIAMNEETTATADDTLTAIYILQKYEIISDTLELSNDPHDAAITAMFRLRRPTQPKSPNALSLYRVTQMRKQIQAFSGSPETAIPKVDSKAFFPSAPQTVYWSLLREASASSAQLQCIMRQSSSEVVPLEGLLNDTLLHASSVYSQLLSWPDSVPEGIKYKVLPLSPETDSVQNKDHVPTSFYLFDCIQHGAMWIGFWCACIHLAQSLLQGYHLCHERSHNSSTGAVIAVLEADVMKSLLGTIGDICASAPCMLGDVDRQGQLNIGGKSKALGGIFLLRAVVVANSVENLPLGLRRSLLGHLGRIGTSVGIKKAWRQREVWLASHQAEAGELLI